MTALLAVAFVGFSAETLIADVHDGDASVAEAEALGVHLVASDAAQPGEGLPGDDLPSRHSAHACHCVHAHGGVLDGPANGNAPHVPCITIRGVSDLMPASLSSKPRLRPPNP